MLVTTGLACSGESIEVTSFAGKPLPAPVVPDEFRAKQEALLDEAIAELVRSPNDPDAIIWAGRRTAYLGRYREAVAQLADHGQ